MGSALPQSKSVPLDLVASRRHRVSISGSGSYQGHLSRVGHLHRVRSASEQVSLSFEYPTKDYLHVLEDGLAEQRPRVGRLYLLKQSVTDPATFLSDDLRRIFSGHVWRLRTLLTLYCCISLLFLTAKVYAFFQQVFRAAQHQQLISNFVYEADRHDTPSLTTSIDISLPPQRLSIAFRGLSPQARLETFVMQAHPSYESNLTACFWVEDSRIEEAFTPATAWPGPVSLVVVTTNAPNSSAYKNLLGYLSTKHASTNTSAHVLYVPSIGGASSNTYLNMARFFARTFRVILFPDGIPKSAMEAVSLDWLGILPADTRHPIVLSHMTHKGFSPQPLAPVVLPSDHPVWCTERFYMFGSRIVDWEDCLWELWLESAGEAPSIMTPRFLHRPKNATGISVPPFAMKIRRRWSARYRSETCAFALKRSHALGALSKTEKRRTQWRKKFCRETVGPSVAEIS